jgi:hypothetical protein
MDAVIANPNPSPSGPACTHFSRLNLCLSIPILICATPNLTVLFWDSKPDEGDAGKVLKVRYLLGGREGSVEMRGREELVITCEEGGQGQCVINDQTWVKK